jgi:uncharacterized membrane protein
LDLGIEHHREGVTALAVDHALKNYPMTDSNTVRLEAFSDGVFAIAITLLVLEIKVPSASELSQAHGLWPALAERWPSYVGFVASFFIVGVMWTNHHALIEYLRRVDRRLLLANLFLLMGVSFLPYPTAVLAQNLANPVTRTDATVFYGVALAFNSLTYNVLWWLGRSQRTLIEPDVHDLGLRAITRRYALTMLGAVVATGLAVLNVWVSLAIHLALYAVNARSERASDIH